MLTLVAALAAFANAPAGAADFRPDRQASATVRIVRPAMVKLGVGSSGGAHVPTVRQTSVTDEGHRRKAILVEFS